MTQGPFDIAFDQLPGEIPVFPLSRVLLLPRCQLPLNIFEPRYLAMVDDALRGDRLVGMIQPRVEQEAGSVEPEALFGTGCAGRIISYTETPDGRMLITLDGVCRFDVAEELALHDCGYRRVRADWSAYEGDMREETDCGIACEDMKPMLRAYLDKNRLVCDKWDEMKDIPPEKLISTLAMVCPFDTQEKQMLLEAPNLRERARVLYALIETAVNGAGARGRASRH